MVFRLGLIALASACLLTAPALAAEAAAAKPAAAVAHKATPAELKAYQKARGLKETGVVDAATKKALAKDKAECKLPGQGGTLDFSDPCNSIWLAII